MKASFRWVATIAAWLLPAAAMAAGGGFFVDDALIGKPGECKVEVPGLRLQAITIFLRLPSLPV